MVCKNCGKENRDGTAFCTGCGTALAAPERQANDGPAAVFIPRKKKNAAALALGALSVVLAIALALSLTGVLGASGGTIASKSFSTPEDAIKYFVDRLKAGDFDGALSACAIGEMAQGFDYKAYAERIQALQSITNAYMPSEYKPYIEYNRSKIEQHIMLQMTCFTVSFILPEEYTSLIDGMFIQLQDGKLPDDLLEELDPTKISGLEIVDIGKANKHDTAVMRENQKKQAKLFGADDTQFRIVLYKHDGNYYVGGFTVIEYGGRWLIQSMSDPLAGISMFGTPIPVSGKSQFDGMLE